MDAGMLGILRQWTATKSPDHTQQTGSRPADAHPCHPGSQRQCSGRGCAGHGTSPRLVGYHPPHPPAHPLQTRKTCLSVR